MSRSKRMVCLLLCLCLGVCMLSACDKKADVQPEDNVFSVYATFYPIYAITEMLMKDVPDTQLHCLVQPQDGCLQDYLPSDWDLRLLNLSADAVIAGGRGLESFENLLYALGENGPAVSSVFHGLNLETFDAVNANTDSESHWLQENPHIYMSTDGALEIANRIAASLAILDAAHAEIYQINLESAKNRLKSIQSEAHGIAGNVENLPVIVMNPALMYLVREYNMIPEICYDRCSGEGLYDAELANCISLLSQAKSRVILIEKQAPDTLKAALRRAGFSVAELDILTTYNSSEGSDGYFDVQLNNAAELRDAFDTTASNEQE